MRISAFERLPPLSLLLAAALLAPTAMTPGCGGAPPREVTVTPFTAEHEPLYENGVDMVRDPSVLEGSWLSTWEDELDQRISMADLVALVTVSTLRTDTDLDRRHTYRLVLATDRFFLGEETLGGEDLVLAAREGEGGYGTVENNERRLLDAQFFAFVKWMRDEDGALVARWHLSPATDTVARYVRELLERRRQIEPDNNPRRTVVVHRN